MTDTQLRPITLPDGSVVEISDVPLEWWDKPEVSGFASPNILAPDPDQPRTYLNPERQHELDISVKAAGVREAITVTPRHLAPWTRVLPQHEHCYFIVVSGHRRRSAAVNAEVGAVPIRIRVYESEQAHRMDVSILNKGRENLTELEEGKEAVFLRKSGWTIEQIAEHFGCSSPQVYNRMSLTKLHPDIQSLLLPEVAEKKRFPVTAATAIGEVTAPTVDELAALQDTFKEVAEKAGIYIEDCEMLEEDEEERRFALQRVLVAVIQQRSLNAARAIEFVKEHTLKLTSVGHHQVKMERYQPRKRREILKNFCDTVSGTVIVDWKPDEFRRVFQNISQEEMDDDFIQPMLAALQDLQGLVKILRIIRDEKHPMHPVALEKYRKQRGEAAA